MNTSLPPASFALKLVLVDIDGDSRRGYKVVNTGSGIQGQQFQRAFRGRVPPTAVGNKIRGPKQSSAEFAHNHTWH